MTPPTYEFGPFRADIHRRLLIRNEEPVKINAKAFALLRLFLENPNRLLLREDLVEHLWPEGGGNDANLAVNVAQVRRALGESPREHRFIVTVPLEGYRFVGQVAKLGAGVSPEPDPGPSTEIALAILPFRVFHAPKCEDPEYLGVGIADTLITHLARTPRLVVRPTRAILRYMGEAVGTAAVAREQRVTYVVEGSVLEEKGRFRLQAQLVRAEGGEVMWSGTARADGPDILATSIQFVAEIRNALGFKAGGASDVTGPTLLGFDNDTRRLYLEGRYLQSRYDPRSLRRSVEIFEEVLGREPLAAGVSAELAESLHALWYFASTPSDNIPERAESAARRALELDGNLASAHAVLGNLLLSYRWDWDKGAEHLDRAVELGPHSSTAWFFHAFHLVSLGRTEAAKRAIWRAQELEPRSIMMQTAPGAVFYYTEAYREALDHFREVLDFEPRAFWAKLFVGRSLLMLERYEEAAEVLRGDTGVPGVNPWGQCYLAHALGRLGKREEALALVLELERLARDEGERALYPAVAWCGLGEVDRVLDWLEEMTRRRSSVLFLLHRDPMWKSLRSHPRFEAIARDVGFPQTD